MIPVKLSFLSRKLFTKVIPIIITLAVFVLAFVLPQGDLKTLLIFSVLIIVFSIYKFNSGIPIGFAIILLVICAILTSQKADDLVKRLAELSYWFLIAGIVCILINFYRNKSKSNKVEIA
jgi:hypothetical protein